MLTAFMMCGSTRVLCVLCFGSRKRERHMCCAHKYKHNTHTHQHTTTHTQHTQQTYKQNKQTNKQQTKQPNKRNKQTKQTKQKKRTSKQTKQTNKQSTETNKTYRAQPAAGHIKMKIGLNEFQGDKVVFLHWLLLQPFVSIKKEAGKEILPEEN